MSTQLDNLRQLHDAIIADLTERYADRVYTIAAYDPFPEKNGAERLPITTPALLLDVESIDEGEEDGTDRQPLRLTITLHCILSFRTSDTQLELREFAADVAARVRHNRWGLNAAVDHPQAINAQPGEFVPEQAGYDSWRVTWEQQVYVGVNIWAGGQLPEEIYLGIAPKIGPEHVDDYFRVDQGIIDGFDL